MVDNGNVGQADTITRAVAEGFEGIVLFFVLGFFRGVHNVDDETPNLTVFGDG